MPVGGLEEGALENSTDDTRASRRDSRIWCCGIEVEVMWVGRE